jgi:hypothetical protein
VLVSLLPGPRQLLRQSEEKRGLWAGGVNVPRSAHGCATKTAVQRSAPSVRTSQQHQDKEQIAGNSKAQDVFQELQQNVYNHALQDTLRLTLQANCTIATNCSAPHAQWQVFLHHAELRSAHGTSHYVHLLQRLRHVGLAIAIRSVRSKNAVRLPQGQAKND